MIRLNLVPSLNFLYMCSLLFLDFSFGIQKVLWFCPGACDPVCYLTFQQLVCFECPTLTFTYYLYSSQWTSFIFPFHFPSSAHQYNSSCSVPAFKIYALYLCPHSDLSILGPQLNILNAHHQFL